MGDKPMRRLAAELAFMFGISLMLLGSMLLVATLAGLPRFAILPASLGIIIGAAFAVLAIKLNKRSVYIFLSVFFCLTGILLLLVALKAIPASPANLWPFASVFAGLALLPAGWSRFSGFSVKFVIPAAAFLLLGILLLVFSFGMAPFSFKTFILVWWPLLLVIAGLILALLSFGPPARVGDEGR